MDGLCRYCSGDCLRLELEDFNGIYRCDGFDPIDENWYSKYREDIRRKK